MALPNWCFTIKFRLVILLMLLFTTCSTTIPEKTKSPTRAPVYAGAAAGDKIFLPAVEKFVYPFTYQPSAADILNPERGFRSGINLLTEDDYAHFRDTNGNTLVFAFVRLDDYRASDLPANLLAALNTAFGRVRGAGLKVVLRFAYNIGPYPDSEPDSSKSQVLRHIEQLTPLLRKHADVIAWMQAGFIGAWGEWHTSTNGLDNLTDKSDILNALLIALPEDRMVQVRYPGDIAALYPVPLSADEAFSGSPQARIGHHNDCFLASDTDKGTYHSSTVAADKAYLSQMSRFTPVGGETCAVNPPRSSCDVALQEMALLHYSEINGGYRKEVVDGWKSGGCYEVMRQRLGYRLTLRAASFPARLSPGGALDLRALMENSGFAAPINPRPVFLVLDGPAHYALPLTVDPRRWEPSRFEFAGQVQLPTDIPAGAYRLSLWLPDAYPSLRGDPRYAIRFANENMWDVSAGVNILGQVMVQ